MRRPFLFMLFLAAIAPSAARAADDVAPPAPQALLAEAFSARYDCALSGVVEIETRKGGVRAVGRTVHVASKLIDDRLHTYARFQRPSYLRGMAFLGIEAKGARSSDERFVYLPSLRRVRRVGGAHSSDSFLGTDLSYHDFERQRAARFAVLLAGRETLGSEPAWRLTARPRHPADHERVDYLVALEDAAILGTHYYKRGETEPYKSLLMPRADMHGRGPCRIPGLVSVRDRQRRTRTDLRVHALEIDAPFEDSLFTMTALETARSIPGMRRAR